MQGNQIRNRPSILQHPGMYRDSSQALYSSVAHNPQKQGRSGTFADFAAASVATLASQGCAESLSTLQPTLQRYPVLPVSERQRIASQLLQALKSMQGRTVAPTDATTSTSSSTARPPHVLPPQNARPVIHTTPPLSTPPIPSTAEFREQFHKTAIAHQATFTPSSSSSPENNHTMEHGEFQGEQRTAAWHALRDRRLTASAFGNALGFFKGMCVQSE